MTKEAELVQERYAAAYRPAPLETIPEWARREVTVDETSPIGGTYKIENSPYADEWFAAWQDPRVRMITTIGPNQGGRTKAMEVASLWSMCHRPGPTQWNGKDNIKAKKFARERWWPMARKCKPLAERLPKDPRLESPMSIVLGNGLPFTMQGANEGNLQEVSIHTQFNDECFQWSAGMLQTAWKRADVSYAWNHKIWNGSVADEEGIEIHGAYEDADAREWNFCCLKCKHPQAYRWGDKKRKGGIRWLDNSKTRPNGHWNYEEVKKTVYYECEKCLHRHSDNLSIRRLMNKSGFYKPTKGNAKAQIKNGKPFYPFGTKVSFRYNILAVNWPGLTWGKWVEEFLEAVEEGRTLAVYVKLKQFWTRRMAEFWNESKYINATRRQVISDYTLYDSQGVSRYMRKLWDEGGRKEVYRFMAVDKQELGYPYVIRAVTEKGETRLIDRGELSSYNEIEHKAEQFGVPQSCVIIDSSYETREVYAAAIARGWLCVKGEDRDSYLHIIENPNTRQRIKVLRPYSERKEGDPGFKFSDPDRMQEIMPGVMAHRTMPKFAKLYLFSNLALKDLLNAFRQGKSSLYWGIPSDVGEAYIKQMNAEVRYRIPSRKGGTIYFWSNAGADGKQRKKPNHYWDCEVMIMLAILLQKLINVDDFNVEDYTEKQTPTAEEDLPFDKAA